MTVWTPGPWKIRKRDGAKHGDDHGLGWDWDWEYDGNPPEPMRGLFVKEADARLIAAAPELADMLRRFIEPGRDFKRFPDAYFEGRALLARIDNPEEAEE